MNYRVHLTLRSANAKTGPIPVSTTERATIRALGYEVAVKPRALPTI